MEAEARGVVDAPWPAPEAAGVGVFAGRAAARASRTARPCRTAARATRTRRSRRSIPGRRLTANGRTFLDAIALGLGDALRADPRVFVYGEDVGGKYGNAFLLLRPLLDGIRRPHHQLAAGRRRRPRRVRRRGARPASGRSARSSSTTSSPPASTSSSTTPRRSGIAGAAPCRWSSGCRGAACATPARTISRTPRPGSIGRPGLKIVVPSTPEDARALMAAAVADPDPVLYYEHIALYRDPRIKQRLPTTRRRRSRSAKRRCGGRRRPRHHLVRRVRARRACVWPQTLAADGIEASVLDLRSRWRRSTRALVLAVARHCSRVLIVHEDSRTGGIGESLAAIIQEEAFESLDAPVRMIGALDTPVPYSPPLEEFFLPSEADVERAARLLVRY